MIVSNRTRFTSIFSQYQIWLSSNVTFQQQSFVLNKWITVSLFPIDRNSPKQSKSSEYYISSFNQIFGNNRPTPDSLVIVTRFHPVDLTLTLLQFLPIGRPFVVYTQYIQVNNVSVCIIEMISFVILYWECFNFSIL